MRRRRARSARQVVAQIVHATAAGVATGVIGSTPAETGGGGGWIANSLALTSARSDRIRSKATKKMGLPSFIAMGCGKSLSKMLKSNDQS